MNKIKYITEKLSKTTGFLVLLPLFYLLHMVTLYQPVLNLKDLFIPVTAWLLGIPLLLFLIVQYARLSLLKYVVVLVYTEVVFFFFNTIQLFFKNYLPFLSHYKYLLPVLAVGALLLIFSARKKKAPPFRFMLYLNTLFIILLLNECVQLVIAGPQRNHPPSSSYNDTTIKPCDSCVKPDVYFLVFDEYQGSKGLKAFWQYDNSGLDTFLTNNGFYNVTNSRSNYNWTSISIGSILNMDYHKREYPNEIDLLQYCDGIKTIANNRVCQFFQQQGYEIYNRSFFPLPGAPSIYDPGFLVDIPELLLTPTLYHKILHEIGWNFGKVLGPLTAPVSDEVKKNTCIQLQQINYTYTNLLAFAGERHVKPVFVYGHFMLPHDPYFYDSTGRLTPEPTWYNQFSVKEGYLPQLKYTNTLIKELVRHLLQPAKRPRIIIIQGDHGFRGMPDNMKDLEFNNLNAIYFPDKQYNQLYDSISSVNTFRVILQKYFNAPLPLLKDSTVYIRHYKTRKQHDQKRLDY